MLVMQLIFGIMNRRKGETMFKNREKVTGKIILTELTVEQKASVLAAYKTSTSLSEIKHKVYSDFPEGTDFNIALQNEIVLFEEADRAVDALLEAKDIGTKAEFITELGLDNNITEAILEASGGWSKFKTSTSSAKKQKEL